MPDLLFQPVLQAGVTLPGVLLCTSASLLFGYAIARLHLRQGTCSRSFAVTLALLPAIVQIVIMLVNGNIGTGVAVAGAFALVRFRSVPGTAREISAIFSAMALGLALGMGFLAIAVIFFLCTAVFTLVLTRLEFGTPSRSHRRLKITIPEGLDYEGIFDDLFQEYTVYTELERVRTTNMGSLYELCYLVELPGSGISKAFLDELRCRNGNLNISCGRVSSVQDEL